MNGNHNEARANLVIIGIFTIYYLRKKVHIFAQIVELKCTLSPIKYNERKSR